MASSCSAAVGDQSEEGETKPGRVPKRRPHAVAVAGVPGPINAAATIAPGPNLNPIILLRVERFALATKCFAM